MTSRAADRWEAALLEWAIPEPILARAPEPPWVLPPQFFKVSVANPGADRPSLRLAREALGAAGSLLDVGCGGGGASLPLRGGAQEITGVDQQEEMLANFAEAWAAAGVPHREVVGRWPEVADQVGLADVVVCNHVVYNVARIEPFLRALTERCRRRVVVELTDTHPTAPFNFLWQHFWQLPRPSEPTAELFLNVLRELGYSPTVESVVTQDSMAGPQDPPRMPRSDYVAFARRRLCLTQDRDEEVDAVLGPIWPLEVERVVAVAWEPPPDSHATA